MSDKPKVGGRRADGPDARPSTSSRVYVDTLKILKYIADLDNVPMADLLDRLARAEFSRRKAELLREINALADEGQKGGR